MASPVKRYQKEMYQNLGFFATWFPGDNLELGEVGVLENGRFTRVSSLAELGIDFTESSPGASQTLQYTSTSGTTVNSVVSAEAARLVSAEISVEFSAKGAFLFHASGIRQIRIEDRFALGREILKAFERKEWDKDWYLVEALHYADCATVIVSHDRSSELVISASSKHPLGSLPLADPKAKLSIKSTRGRVFHLVAGKQLKPLYSCIKVNEPWFRPTEIEPVRGIGEEDGVSFDRPSIDDLLES